MTSLRDGRGREAHEAGPGTVGRRGTRGHTPGLRQRIRYRFDNLLARGTWAVLLWLGVVTLCAILASSVLLWIFQVDFAGSEAASWTEDVWQSLLRVLDPGTMAADVGWGRRLLALLVTIFGILIAGTLIGLIASGVEQRVEAMRRGRSAVVESDHVVVLGASSRLPAVVGNLALANLGHRTKAIVVLAEHEPVELAEDLRASTGDLHGSYLVVRRGDPTRATDLEMAAIRQARAVIVLGNDGDGDGEVVTALLSAAGALGGFDRVPLVAEIRSPDVAAQVERASDGAVHVVMAGQSNGRIAAYALRESGLNQVVMELLEHHGADIYVRPVAALAGMPFGACVLQCTEVRPIGLMRPHDAIELNPRADTILDDGDRLIVVAEDGEAATRLRREADPAPSIAWQPPPPASTSPHRVIVLGWNELGFHLLSSLDEIAAPGSAVEIVFDPRRMRREDIELPPSALAVTLRPADRAIWDLDEDLDISTLTAIMVLAQRAGPAADVDGETLLNHLLLRRQIDERSGPSPNVLVELLDPGNVGLAQDAGASDIIVSAALTSGLMTQLADQPERRPVLLRLYEPGGPSLRLLPAAEMGCAGDLRVRDIVASCYRQGFLAIGWRAAAGIRLNAPLAERVALDSNDQIVAIG